MAIFFSIDVETTGLDPTKHNVIEFAAIMADTHHKVKPVEFHRYLRLENTLWTEYCLNLHKTLMPFIMNLIGQESPQVCGKEALQNHFITWLYQQGWSEMINGIMKPKKMTPAGKNFGSFDLQFLKQFGMERLFRHRAIDPGTLFYNPEVDGDTMPDLKACLERAKAQGANIVTSVSHTALDDAWSVADLIHWHYNKKLSHEVWP